MIPVDLQISCHHECSNYRKYLYYNMCKSVWICSHLLTISMNFLHTEVHVLDVVDKAALNFSNRNRESLNSLLHGPCQLTEARRCLYFNTSQWDSNVINVNKILPNISANRFVLQNDSLTDYKSDLYFLEKYLPEFLVSKKHGLKYELMYHKSTIWVRK